VTTIGNGIWNKKRGRAASVIRTAGVRCGEKSAEAVSSTPQAWGWMPDAFERAGSLTGMK
jgi:hypothetical protein